jgi:hypothetical protein
VLLASLGRFAELALVALGAVDRDLTEVGEPKRSSLARLRAPTALGAGEPH